MVLDSLTINPTEVYFEERIRAGIETYMHTPVSYTYGMMVVKHTAHQWRE